MVPSNPLLGDKGVHTFSRDIRPKVIVIAQQEFELTYLDLAVQHFNHLHLTKFSHTDISFFSFYACSPLFFLSFFLSLSLSLSLSLYIYIYMYIYYIYIYHLSIHIHVSQLISKNIHIYAYPSF